MSVQWQWAAFAGLDGHAVHAMLMVRQQVFVLEQQCLYPDIDAVDLQASHLLGWQQQQGQRVLAAYLRCMAPGVVADEIVIGRVLVMPFARGGQLGRQLMEEGIRLALQAYPEQACIRLSAQSHLEQFYASLGFQRVSEPYLEDDIPHIAMLR